MAAKGSKKGSKKAQKKTVGGAPKAVKAVHRTTRRKTDAFASAVAKVRRDGPTERMTSKSSSVMNSIAYAVIDRLADESCKLVGVKPTITLATLESAAKLSGINAVAAQSTKVKITEKESLASIKAKCALPKAAAASGKLSAAEKKSRRDALQKYLIRPGTVKRALKEVSNKRVGDEVARRATHYVHAVLDAVMAKAAARVADVAGVVSVRPQDIAMAIRHDFEGRFFAGADVMSAGGSNRSLILDWPNASAKAVLPEIPAL